MRRNLVISMALALLSSVFVGPQAYADGWSHSGWLQQNRYLSASNSTADSDIVGVETDTLDATASVGATAGYASASGEYWNTWEYTGDVIPTSHFYTIYTAESSTANMGSVGAYCNDPDEPTQNAFASGNDYESNGPYHDIYVAPRTIVQKAGFYASAQGANVSAEAQIEVQGPL